LFLALDCACGWATGKFYDHQKYNQRGWTLAFLENGGFLILGYLD
jgi:hypothetical protein